MKAAKKTSQNQKKKRPGGVADTLVLNDADFEKAGLSPFNSVTVPGDTIFGAIEYLASAAGITASSPDPEGWRATARNTGTHTLKMMELQDRQQEYGCLDLRSR